MAGTNVGVDRYLGHSLILDAHTKNPMEKMALARYHAFGHIPTAQTYTVVVNTLKGIPIIVARPVTVDRIAFYVQTLALAAVARAGIYNVDSALLPTSLVVDGGEVSVATTGVKAATISVSLAKGIYLVSIVSNGAPILNASSTRVVSFLPLGLEDTTFGYATAGYNVAFNYAALPNPFTAGYGEWDSATYPLIALRVASLD